ncbi:serine/threonine-protein kinase [Sphaerisporangium perillae]|uniref:serine/threonine-protein kinase n=1 Tax=Sphaerisporangium perillae TaxID=2935860 RepID=UPI00200C218F|nr:serine/threonine-protein kinase [Sphaerisporangium perillae]
MRAGIELAGRYRLERLLGRGGMGEVWRGVDQVLDRPVAVKLLLANLLGDDRLRHEALARFRREGRAAARLNHSNITAVYDLGEHRDTRNGVELTFPFLVLEFLEGRDLKSVLDDHPGGLPLGRVLDYGVQAADALAAAHAAGIVHRDIKPANLMLLDNGTIKVCDFGIARLHGATAGLSATGTMIGTLLYMPPEQLEGYEVDHRADLYALGATLYHLLSGQPVFPATDLRALAYMHATKTPTPPSALRPGISPDVDRLITALLAKLPDERPASATDTAASLRSARSENEWRIAEAERITRFITDPDYSRSLLAEAEHIVHSTFRGDIALREIAVVAAWHDPAEAERIACSIFGPYPTANALREIAGVVAGHDRDHARALLAEAERIARSITVLPWQVDTLRQIAMVVAGLDPAEAERIARSFTEPDSQARALHEIAEVVAGHDRNHARALLAEAERIACSIPYCFSRSLALRGIAEVVAGHDRNHARALLTEAERIARSITDPELVAHALLDIAEAAARHDRDHARVLLAEAERIARSFPDIPKYAAHTLREVAEVVAGSDPTEAERIARSIAEPEDAAHALHEVVKVVARLNPAEAERIARSIAEPEDAAHALLGIAEVVARHDRDHARALLAEAERTAPSIAGSPAAALREIAKAVAGHDPAEAERIAQSIADLFSRSLALYEIAEVAGYLILGIPARTSSK